MEFDPYSEQSRIDPFPIYARLQKKAPVYRNDELDFWAITRHGDVDAALRDPALFSSANGPLLDPSVFGPRAHTFLSIVAMDPPRHGATRALAAATFGPAGAAELELAIVRITRTHLEPAVERGSFDFVEDLAARVPMDVVSEMLGVPGEDRERVRELAYAASDRPPGSRDVSHGGAAALAELVEYLLGLIAERRRRPREDLTSALVAAELDGRPLVDAEITPFLVLLIAAGYETVTRLLAAAWYWAWRNPVQREAAFSGRIGDWVAETLRYDGPVQYVLRTTTREVEVAGTVLPRGARVLLMLAAANRDPEVFPDPDRYDLSRDTTRGLSFGLGPHFCLGAPLARLQTRVVLRELAARVRADYQIEESRARPVYTTNVRGFGALPTTVTPR